MQVSAAEIGTPSQLRLLQGRVH